MKRIALLPLTLLICGSAPGAPKRPQILTEDVTRFFQIYDAAGGHPTAEILDRDYLAPGTDSLHRFAEYRRVTGTAMADMIEKHPEVYIKAKTCLAVLPDVKRRLTAAMAKFAALYPEARFPPIAFLVGRNKPVGMAKPDGVFMGLEALCSADFMDPNLEDRFVHTIAHEYAHVQQTRDHEHTTVLGQALGEGTAEFIGELISGDIGNYQHKAWTKGHEAAIEAAFIADEDKTDTSGWFGNGPGTADHPGDLGYWVGYRIVKSYYARAKDKHQALREIFDIADPKAFLAKSGWQPAAQ